MLSDSTTYIGSATVSRDYAAEGRKGNAFPVGPNNGQPFQLSEDIEGYNEGFYVYSASRNDWVKQEDYQDLPYDIGLTVFDRPRSSDIVCKHYAVRTFQIPKNFERSLARASVEATSDYRFTVKILSVDGQTENEIGYIDFSSLGLVGVFTATTPNVPMVVLRGETLIVQAAEERDVTLKSIDITIFANQLTIEAGL